MAKKAGRDDRKSRPGLINTHHQMVQSLTRAIPGVQNAELFSWLQGLYPIWVGITPNADIYALYPAQHKSAARVWAFVEFVAEAFKPLGA